ncbi:MAG: BamA/TamA family outer membrane protein, partial [Deltaproteobacteria bacterium]|nr:BamA/TamA family outer membrane protein [Deltaproteobacteria bacterium]
ALISEKGYPHVKVKGEVSISEDGSKAGIAYRVDEQPLVKMGQVWYQGNFRTPKRILENELELKPEDPFSLAKMLRGQRNLRNMNIFNSVRFKTIGLKEKKEKVALFVEVEEKKNYFVELGVGYETQRGFFVDSKAGDYNLFGTNKSAWLGVESSQIGYRAEAAITEPRLFGSRTSANLNVFTERREEFNQDFGTRIHGASLGFTRKFFQKISTGLNFNFEYRDQFRSDSAKVNYDTDEFEPRSVLTVKPFIVYDSRDSFIRPQKGLFSSFSVDISNGIQNSVDNFFKYRVDLRYFLTPFRRVTFACLGRAGYIDPYGDLPKVPDDQLFFLGGTSDVRGFDENLLRFDANGDS